MQHLKDARLMGWHPLIIKWCLYLRHLSGKAYETTRSSGCIKLLLQRTLRDYTHCASGTTGFSSDVDQQTNAGSRCYQVPEWKEYVVLVLNEIYIKEDLVYNKRTGALI